MNRPPHDLRRLSDEYILYWIVKTEKALKAEIDRIAASDMRFDRVLKDALRVQDEADRREKP